MTCSYCGARNAEGEQRCARCGRKPGDTLHLTTGALATQPRPAPLIETHEAPPPRVRPAQQASLFQDRVVSKVVPIENYVSVAPIEAAPRVRKPTPRRAAQVHESQAALDFLTPEPAGKPRTLGTTVEAVIYCEAPVATPLHRAVAAGLDWSMVLIAYGLFLLAFQLMGGSIVLSRANLVVYGAALALVALTYGLVWLIAGTESAGMHWMRLRLTTFDGYPPEAKHRLFRFAGSCLSFCTVLGLLWSLADEESLTWQDHMSRTFPTPLGAGSEVFRRR